jgi:hypothetical protein
MMQGIKLTWSYADLSEGLKEEIERFRAARQAQEAERSERQRAVLKRQMIEDTMRQISATFEDEDEDDDDEDEDYDEAAGGMDTAAGT